MKIQPVPWLLMIAAGLHAVPAAAVVPDAQARVEQALHARLSLAYPSVTRWEIEAMPAVRRAARTMTATGPQVQQIVITRIGARSAVWVGPAAAADSRRGEWLWFSVAGYQPVVVATHTLPARSQVDVRDGDVQERDVLAAGCQTLSGPAALAGMRVKRSVAQGEVLCAAELEVAPAVSRGEEVTVRYQGPALTLMSRGIAQGDALLGKPVTIRNPSSGDCFTATVSGMHEVTVND